MPYSVDTKGKRLDYDLDQVPSLSRVEQAFLHTTERYQSKDEAMSTTWKWVVKTKAAYSAICYIEPSKTLHRYHIGHLDHNCQ